MSSLITRELIRFARGRFKLDWEGDHGVSHWARVRHNGLLLAEQTGANARVVEILVITCRDADRLDLGRVGIRPDPERLCTSLRAILNFYRRLTSDQSNGEFPVT